MGLQTPVVGLFSLLCTIPWGLGPTHSFSVPFLTDICIRSQILVILKSKSDCIRPAPLPGAADLDPLSIYPPFSEFTEISSQGL